MTLGDLLRPRELTVLRAAMCARANDLGGGRYLTTDAERKSAERMIARNFLTKADELRWLGDNSVGLVVAITDDNIAAINSALGNNP